MRETRSPIKNLPVRQAGQSLRERFSYLVDDELLYYYMAMALLFMVVLVKWTEYFSKPTSPWLWTAMFLVSASVFAIKFLRIKKETTNLKLGLVGEEAVGQYLEEKLRPMGCQVLHDIQFEGFNIDHVVIGQGGVYAIETKTHSKPAHGAASIKYDGEHVTVNGFAPERDPVVQAKAGANSLSELLEQTTGKRFAVKPVLVYPGWFIDRMPPNAAVWVLNEKALPTFIGNAGKVLTPEDVALITYHLKRYVIVREQRKE